MESQNCQNQEKLAQERTSNLLGLESDNNSENIDSESKFPYYVRFADWNLPMLAARTGSGKLFQALMQADEALNSEFQSGSASQESESEITESRFGFLNHVVPTPDSSSTGS